ncbi:MAG: hypothetical protein OET90_09190 [Desulfuromonadales bacterium]|nr:hypothetical protein [Desulfuromonadales bacterium]
MKVRLSRRTILPVVVIAVYLAVLAGVYVLLKSQQKPLPPDGNNCFVIFQEVADGMELCLQEGCTEGSSVDGVLLLPIGPEEGTLPGSYKVWREVLASSSLEQGWGDSFDTIQAVSDLEEFSQGAVAEVHLNGSPVKTVYLGEAIYSLSSTSGQVEIIDCRNPAKPVIFDTLEHESVLTFEVYNGLGYFLVKSQAVDSPDLVVLDLKDPFAPKQLSLNRLPRGVYSFKIIGSHLLASARTGKRGKRQHYVYALTKELYPTYLTSTSHLFLNDDNILWKEHLFNSNSSREIEVYDFSDPLNPELVSTLKLPNVVTEMVRSGERIIAWSEPGNLYLVDISSLSTPRLIDTVPNVPYYASLMYLAGNTYYFTQSGYLRVFPQLPSQALEGNQGRDSLTVKGGLFALEDNRGFGLLGSEERPTPDAVRKVTHLLNHQDIVDAAVWRQHSVALYENGRLDVLAPTEGQTPQVISTLNLEPGLRWLAADQDWLCVGGQGVVYVFRFDDGRLNVLKRLELPVVESPDGVIVNDVLAVAVGKDGLISYSLKEEAPPFVAKAAAFPLPLIPHLDVRRLSVNSDGRLFLAAGNAGFINGQLDSDGRFLLTGFVDFKESVNAVAVTSGLCLVATEDAVTVVDVRDRSSSQRLGHIELSGVDRFKTASPDYWAGLVPGQGWVCLSNPRLLLPKQTASMAGNCFSLPAWMSEGVYRLNLINRSGISSVRERITVPCRSVGHGVRGCDAG